MSGPQPSGGLQHPGLAAVHQEEGVVVAEGFWVLPALPPLTVELQEVRDHGQRRPGAVATLQSQPVEGIRRSVFLGVWEEDRFVSAGHKPDSSSS